MKGLMDLQDTVNGYCAESLCKTTPQALRTPLHAPPARILMRLEVMGLGGGACCG